MNRCISLLLLLIFLGEYGIFQMLGETGLQYKGRTKTDIIVYDPTGIGDGIGAIPIVNGKCVFDWNGEIYEIVPTSKARVQLWRR